MKFIKFLILGVMMYGMAATPAHATDKFADITKVVEKYLVGTSMGKPELVTEAFLPSLEVQWLGDENKLMRRPGPEYISRIEKGKTVPRYGQIVAIDATSRSAMAKVEIKWNDRLYTDYMLLLKVEGEWKISNKIATWIEIEKKETEKSE